MVDKQSNDFECLSIGDLADGLDKRIFTSSDLVTYFTDKITREDKDFNSIAFINPDAAFVAQKMDDERGAGQLRGVLHGIPIVIKDNIDTADKMMTTAGSLALDGARVQRDANLVSRLREGGAIILAKTNLSEWANFRSTKSCTGWSSRGGQVRNAYAIDRTPGGSSSGSAVAVARSFCAGAIGTETDGSIVVPAAMNSLVGIKPTVGMVSRTGVIPISFSQDTAGPIAKTVTDASTILSVVMGHDPADSSSKDLKQGFPRKFTQGFNRNALKGKRIGVVRNYSGFQDAVDKIFDEALCLMKEDGAEIVDDISLPDQQTIRPHEIKVMRTEFKVSLNAYLAGSTNQNGIHSLSDLINFNEQNAQNVMPYFQQEQLIAAEATNGLDDPDYISALKECRRLTREEGIDKALLDHSCCALVAPTTSTPWAIDFLNGDNRIGGSSCLAAVSGYPSVTVPMGYVSGLPTGLSFIGRAWEDYLIIDLAYAFEQISMVRCPAGNPERFLN